MWPQRVILQTFLLLDFKYNMKDFADINRGRIEENRTLRAPTDVPK